MDGDGAGEDAGAGEGGGAGAGGAEEDGTGSDSAAVDGAANAITDIQIGIPQRRTNARDHCDSLIRNISSKSK